MPFFCAFITLRSQFHLHHRSQRALTEIVSKITSNLGLVFLKPWPAMSSLFQQTHHLPSCEACNVKSVLTNAATYLAVRPCLQVCFPGEHEMRHCPPAFPSGSQGQPRNHGMWQIQSLHWHQFCWPWVRLLFHLDEKRPGSPSFLQKSVKCSTFP